MWSDEAWVSKGIITAFAPDGKVTTNRACQSYLVAIAGACLGKVIPKISETVRLRFKTGRAWLSFSSSISQLTSMFCVVTWENWSWCGHVSDTDWLVCFIPPKGRKEKERKRERGRKRVKEINLFRQSIYQGTFSGSLLAANTATTTTAN